MITDEDIVSCSFRLVEIEDHPNPVILNFASALRTGGGWVGFYVAQEESICRASGLYPSLKVNHQFYDNNHKNKKFYTNDLIYSPNVPFFKDNFLDKMFEISVITSAAVKIDDKYHEDLRYLEEASRTMRNRIQKILTCAIYNNHKTIALGAFGCGVFRNNPVAIAQIFKDLLIDEGFANYFDYIVFPIPEFHYAQQSLNFEPFVEILQCPIQRFHSN